MSGLLVKQLEQLSVAGRDVFCRLDGQVKLLSEVNPLFLEVFYRLVYGRDAVVVLVVVILRAVVAIEGLRLVIWAVGSGAHVSYLVSSA